MELENDDDIHRESVDFQDIEGCSRDYEVVSIFCGKVKDYLNDNAKYQHFLRCLCNYSQGIITRTELRNMIAELLGNHDQFLGDFENVMYHFQENAQMRNKKPGSTAQTSELRQVMEKRSRNKNDLDLSKCENYSPSYWFPSESYQNQHLMTKRSSEQLDYLNYELVCRPVANPVYKNAEKNRYEELFFKFEDEKHEIDMLIGYLRSTEKACKKFIEMIQESKDNPKRLASQNLMCIERLYGDRGLQVVELLKNNPVRTLPIILSRLEQKLEELIHVRSEFDRLWAPVIAENYRKRMIDS